MPHQCTNCGYVFADGSKEMLSGCPECSGATFQFYPDDVKIPKTPPDESPPDPEGGRVSRHVGNATSTVRGWMSSGSSKADTSVESDGSDGSNTDGSGMSGTSETTGDTESSNHIRSEESNRAREPNPTGDPDTPNDPDTRESGDESDAVADERGVPEADLLENEAHGSEDSAQASARSEFVSPDKIPSSSSSSSSEIQTSSSPPEGRVVREPTGDRPDLTELREELNDQFESIKIVEPGEYELNLMGLYDREEYIIALQENGRYVIQMPETWIGTDDE